MDQQVLKADVGLENEQIYTNLKSVQTTFKNYLVSLDAALCKEDLYELSDIASHLKNYSDQFLSEKTLSTEEIEALETIIRRQAPERVNVFQPTNIPKYLAAVALQLLQLSEESLLSICKEYEGWADIFDSASSVPTVYAQNFFEFSSQYKEIVYPTLGIWTNFTEQFPKDDHAILNKLFSFEQTNICVTDAKKCLDTAYTSMLATAIKNSEANVLERGDKILKSNDTSSKSLKYFFDCALTFRRLEKEYECLEEAQRFTTQPIKEINRSTKSQALFITAATKVLQCTIPSVLSDEKFTDRLKLAYSLKNCMAFCTKIIEKKNLSPEVVDAHLVQQKACSNLFQDVALRDITSELRTYGERNAASRREDAEYLNYLLDTAFSTLNDVCERYDPSCQLQQKDELIAVLNKMVIVQRDAEQKDKLHKAKRSHESGATLLMRSRHLKESTKSLREKVGRKSFNKSFSNYIQKV